MKINETIKAAIDQQFVRINNEIDLCN